MEQDEVFRLTPVDVRRYEFGSAMRGYDRARVDQFREQVADELERLARHNQDLEAKARSLAEQLKHYRERDKAINEALVSAQQLREEMRAQAEREVELRLREAESQAAELQSGARNQMATLKREIESLDRARRSYLAQLKTLAERHLSEVEALEQLPSPGIGSED